jgi:moderate conductance mechanosensitive channel
MQEIFTATFWETLIEKLINWMVGDLPGLLVVAVVIFAAFKIVRFSMKRLRIGMAHRAEKNDKVDTNEAVKRIETLVNILHAISKVVLWSIFIMVFLQKFGFNIGPILASAGIVGLAVGFGAQELVRDFISGFFIILENQIRTGDVATINGTSGLVEKIELRTITLRDFSGVTHVFQNGKINSTSNMTKDWSAQVFDIGVAYKEDVVKVMDIMKKVGDELKDDPKFGQDILEPIEIFGLDKFADSALVIKARLKTRPIQQWSVGREYRKRLKQAFDAENIEIPFPHTTVYWGEEIKPLQLKVQEEMRKSAAEKAESLPR